MKRQTFMKSTLCLLMALVCNVAWAQTAMIEVSTKVDAPEHMYEIKSGAGHWMTSFTSTSGTVRGLFAFYDDNDESTENAYKIYSVTHQKWVSYTKAASYSGGANKAVLVDTQAEANAWNAITKTNGGNDYYQFSPYRQDGAVATIYWNWHGGTNSNPYNNVEKTVGFHTADAASTDAGSRWVLSEVTEFAEAEAINVAKSFIKVAPGYPKKTSGAYVLLSAMTESGIVSAASLTGAESLYKTATDIILPENDKAYTIANNSLLEDGGTITRYLYYTAGSPLSVKEGKEFASVYVCRQLSNGVYAFVTSDGKVLTWMGQTSGLESDAGYIENGNRYGYSSEYGKVYLNSSEWNKITVHKHLTAEKNLGHLCIKGYRSSSHTGASFVVNAPTGDWNRNTGDGGNYGTDFSSAWIFTEVTHTNTAEQNERLAEIDATVSAIAHVDANASKLGDGIGYAHYMLGETKSIDAAAVKTAINNATTAEEVNAIKNSFKYEVPQTGVLYALYDATLSVYLDIHNLGADDQAPSYNQLATMNADKQYLYITGNETNGTWKIHSTPKGGNYLHKNSTKAWDSWVSSEGADFNWEIEVAGTGEEITYSLKTSNSEGNNHVGSTTREAGQELYVDVAHANALVFKLVEANVTPEEELAYIKMATKATLTQYTAKLKNQPGYYYCTINGTKVYDAAEVTAAIDAAQTKEAVAEIAAAVKTLTLILPEFGKAYTMTLVANNNDKTQYKIIATDDGTLEAKTEGENSVFYCLQSNSNGYPYIFVSEDGYVLGYNKLVETYNTTDDRHNFKVEGMYDKSSGYITSAAADRLGMVCITTAARNADDGTGGVGCLIFKYTANSATAWDNSSAPYHNGTYTSAIIMTEVKNYSVPTAQKTKIDAILGKDALKTQVEAIRNDLKNQPGYYYCTINGKKYYDADAIFALIDATQSLKTLNEISTAVTNKTLITPEVGKYYRIKGKTSGNYIDASGQTNAQMNMKADPNILGSIFLFEEGSRLKNMSTGTYVYNTHSIGATQGNANTWTFISSGTGYFKVKSNYSSPWLHDSGNKANRCSSDGADHEFIIEEVPSYALTIDAPAPAGATATWNGETKALPATWTICEGMTITNPELTLNYDNVNYTFGGLFEGEQQVEFPLVITTLEANRNFTAKFSPAFFSKSTKAEDLVPVRIRNVRNNDYTIRLNTPDNSYTGQAINSGVTAYGENEIWYLVGNEESFKIYHRIAGTDLHIVLAGTSENSAASMGNTDTNADFCLQPSGAGYTICPTGNKNQSFNMNGGAGKDIKLYKTSDGGSNWAIEKMDVTNTLTLNVNVDQVWESSPRVAELTLTIDGLAGQTRILGDVEGQALYLPVGATYEVSSMTYRGYTYNGCTENEGVLTASYTANDERTLFYSLRDGHPYRIPAIATAPNGDIFAICDYRPCGNDIGYGEVDLVCRVSSDNGVTWTEERTIADGLGHINDGIWKMGYGDPAIVADRESNKVLVMSVCGNVTCYNGTYGATENENPNRVSRLYITYDEATGEWVYGEPEEVTYSVYDLFKDDNDNVYVSSLFIGAGKICQSRVVKKGEYYRLYCAVWAVRNSNDQHHNYVIYSDDFGQSWNLLGSLGYNNSPAPHGNEPKCEELPDGTVVLSSRKYNGRYFNLFTFDNEGKTEEEMYTTGSWDTVASSNDIDDGLSFGGNSTNGEIYKVKAIHKESGSICDLMFQSIPTGSGRDNVAIYYKEMEYNADGTNKYDPQTFSTGWTKGKHVSTKGSCYSTMILQADGRLGFFFEEDPSGYCMVYIPYSIEDVTGGAYRLYTVNSTIGEYKIGTFYASEAMQIPEGIKAYVATNAPVMNDGVGVITMEELEGIIPAKTGAVLRGEADDYKFIPSISYGTPVEGNMMVGYEAADNKSDSMKEVNLQEVANKGDAIYFLTVKNGKAGFYAKTTGEFSVANNKAYLQIPKEGQDVRAIYFDFDDNTTAIESALEDEATGVIYDLQGRQLKKATSNGIYIVNGKKVLK